MCKKILVVISLTVSLIGSLQAADFVIQPTSNQDAPCYSGYVELNHTIGWFGQYNGGQMAQVSIYTLPLSLTSDMIASAVLEVPQPDMVWRSDIADYPQLYVLNLKHIDATDDDIVKSSDLQAERDLGLIGTLRAAGPLNPDNSRIVSFDVTSFVKSDMDAKRKTFAWKTETLGMLPLACNYFMMPTVDNTWDIFPLHGGKLSISLVPEPAIMTLLLINCLGVIARKRA